MIMIGRGVGAKWLGTAPAVARSAYDCSTPAGFSHCHDISLLLVRFHEHGPPVFRNACHAGTVVIDPEACDNQ